MALVLHAQPYAIACHALRSKIMFKTPLWMGGFEECPQDYFSQTVSDLKGWQKESLIDVKFN